MSNDLLQQLENKIASAIETIELLKLQLEEFAEKNAILIKENAGLASKQTEWEQSLSSLLEKLNSVAPVDLVPTANKTTATT